MKKFTMSVLASVACLCLFAQTTITNGNMETWTGSGATVEPTQWNSNKTGGGNAATGPQTCFKDTTNPHGGTACAKILTGNVFGIVVNGSMTTGKVEAPSFSKTEGYIHTIPSNSDYRMTFTGRPDSLVFWYRYTPSGSDYPGVEARLHVGNAYTPETPVNGNHLDSTVNIIARGQWAGSTATVGSWTRASFPLVYVDNRTPEYILIACTSSASQTGGVSGSAFWIDDFEAIYNPSIATNTISPLTYYVSASAGASVTVPFGLTGTFNAGNTVTAQLSNASGSFASPVIIGSVSATSSGSINATIPAGTAAGTGYRIRVVSSNPALIASDNGSNITIVPCSNSIAPSAIQNLLTSTNGNPISVSETPTATSREWKYTTTSGSGYTSFGTAETGTTYTPNFSTAGTYYVVCVSSFPGSLTVTSNEVQINVVTNSIAPATAQNILINTNGNLLTVTETPTATSREWKYTTTSGSGYTSFGTAETGTTYTPNFSTAGTYYVVCVSSFPSSLAVTSNEVQINVVTNSIAPTTTQNILTNTNGSLLTVTETPTATSREWKYTTTSGSGYTSFGTAETGTTYTPNFSTAGTYYVVCVSSFPVL
ncbi:MAG: PCMD domain-containing protein [Bacteroidetes bacterium]|nr:PCMD domain-containing protein [Bacteroidota bacterium]